MEVVGRYFCLFFEVDFCISWFDEMHGYPIIEAYPLCNFKSSFFTFKMIINRHSSGIETCHIELYFIIILPMLLEFKCMIIEIMIQFEFIFAIFLEILLKYFNRILDIIKPQIDNMLAYFLLYLLHSQFKCYIRGITISIPTYITFNCCYNRTLRK